MTIRTLVPDEATAYYIDRLGKLAEFCEKYPRRYYYFDAELMISDTRLILTALSRWLNLDSMLSDRYRRFSKTGIAKAGDSSRAITSGTVIGQVNHYPDISLDADLVRRALAGLSSLSSSGFSTTRSPR